MTKNHACITHSHSLDSVHYPHCHVMVVTLYIFFGERATRDACSALLLDTDSLHLTIYIFLVHLRGAHASFPSFSVRGLGRD